MAIRFGWIKKQASKVAHLEGDVIEVGVFRGKGARHLLWNLPEKQVHLFDTWEGMTDLITPGKDINKWAKYNKVNFENVKKYLRDQVGEDLYEHFHFYKGFFPETARGLEDKRFCLVNIDVDLYQSTLDACEWVYPRMVTGGIMMFNDYSCPGCPGATEAVDSFFADKPEKINCQGTERTEVTKL